MNFHQYAFIALLALAERAQLGACADKTGDFNKGQDLKEHELLVRRLKPDTKSRKKSTAFHVAYDSTEISNKAKSRKWSPEIDITPAMTTKARSAKSQSAQSRGIVAASMSYDTSVPIASPFGFPTALPTMLPTEGSIIPDSGDSLSYQVFFEASVFDN